MKMLDDKIKIELNPSQRVLICSTIKNQIKEIEQHIKIFKSHELNQITPKTCDSIAKSFEEDKAELENILEQIYKGVFKMKKLYNISNGTIHLEVSIEELDTIKSTLQAELATLRVRARLTKAVSRAEIEALEDIVNALR